MTGDTMVHLRKSIHESPGPIGDWGADAVLDMMHDLTFPMTRDQLLARAGEWRVPMPGELDLRLADLLAPTSIKSFDSPEAVVRAARAGVAAATNAPVEYHRPFDRSRESSDHPGGSDVSRPIPDPSAGHDGPPGPAP